MGNGIGALSTEDLGGLDHTRTPMWAFDPVAGRILWANRSGLVLWQAETMEDLRRRALSKGVSTAKRMRLRALIAEVEAGRTPETNWVIYPAGQPRPIQVRCLPIRIPAEDPDRPPRVGVLVEVIGSWEAADVGGLRAAEALDHAPSAIEICRPDGTPLLRNAAAIAALGPVEPAARPLADHLIRSPDAEALRGALREGRCLALKAPARTVGGEVRYAIEVRPMPDPASGAPLMLITATDETRQHQLAREVEDARAFLRAVVDISPDALFAHAADGTFALSNRANSALFGREPDAVEGQPVGSLLGDVAPGTAWEKENADLLARGGDIARTQELRLPDGRKRTYRVIKRPLHLRNGSYVVGAAADVTDLVDARRRAEASERAKSAFLAAMSHELRTPLNAILGFSEILRDGVGGPVPPEKVVDYAATIHEAGTLLLQEVTDLLDLAKLEAGKTEIDPTRVDLAPLLHSVTRMLGAKASRRGLTLTIDPGLGRMEAWADPRALRRIVTNLVSNALKFTQPGGSVTISVIPADDPGGVAITVADTGPGIAAEHLSRLFAPFEQVDNVYRRQEEEGTGLGLAIVKRLTERHGGRVDVDSRQGVGTRMTVHLPGPPGAPDPDA